MRRECNSHPLPPPPTCRKLREYSACSYWSTAERCENRQPASIGRQAERTGSRLLFFDRQREPAARFYLSKGGEDDSDEGHMQDSPPVSGDITFQIFTVWFLLLDNEPISGSHFSSFLHILPLKQYKG